MTSTITLHTGNILNTLQDKLEELNENSDSKSPGYKNTELLNSCKLLGTSSLKTSKKITLKANEDEKFSTTVKLFLAKDASPDTVFETVSTCHSSFENKINIDILILSFSRCIASECQAGDCNKSAVEYMLKFYEQAEKLFKTGIVKNLGIADIGATCFESLYEKVEVKPSVAQVNISGDSFCDKTEMVKFSKEHDILLLTHTDVTPFVTSERLNSVLGGEKKEIRDIKAAVKYSIEAKRRAVLLAKGYFVFGEI